MGFTARWRYRIPAGSKALKSRARRLARVTPEDGGFNGKRASNGETREALLEGKPLEGKTLYTAVRRNKLTRPVVEQTVESGRNAEDGP